MRTNPPGGQWYDRSTLLKKGVLQIALKGLKSLESLESLGSLENGCFLVTFQELSVSLKPLESRFSRQRLRNLKKKSPLPRDPLDWITDSHGQNRSSKPNQSYWIFLVLACRKIFWEGLRPVQLDEMLSPKVNWGPGDCGLGFSLPFWWPSTCMLKNPHFFSFYRRSQSLCIQLCCPVTNFLLSSLTFLSGPNRSTPPIALWGIAMPHRTWILRYLRVSRCTP